MDSGAQVVIINMLTVPKTDMNLTLASYELYGDLGSVRLADERLGYPVRADNVVSHDLPPVPDTLYPGPIRTSLAPTLLTFCSSSSTPISLRSSPFQKPSSVKHRNLTVDTLQSTHRATPSPQTPNRRSICKAIPSPNP